MVMPDREVGGRFNPGGAPRGDNPRTATSAATADAPLLLDFDDEFPPVAPRARALATDAATADRLQQRLAAFGMRGISKLRLTHNRSTLVSFRAGTLRLHAAFQHANEDVLRAVAVFVSGRGAARVAARRVIVAYEIPRDASPRPPRRTRLHPDDEALAERLRAAHDRLNRERFGGALKPIRVTVSRRMTTRLGHYAPARSHPGGAEIAISRRHIRRHGWREAFDTLLHEMVHQWQEESGHPIDHGPHFRRKAREVGTTPRARRVLR